VEVGDGFPDRLWNYEDFPLGADRSADDPSSTGLVDLSFIRAALRRSRRVWWSATAVGFILGAGLFAHTKPAYQATASLLIQNDPNIDAFTGMETSSLVAQEPAVAQLALKNLGMPGGTLKYSVTIFSNQVLTISIRATTPDKAGQEVDAIANAFLQVHAQTVQTQMAASTTGESQQLAQDQQTVDSLGKQVSQVSAEPSSPAQAKQLKSLQVQRTSALAALAALKQTLSYDQANAQITASNMVTNSKIIYTSVPAAATSRKKTIIEYIGGGLFAGLVIGMAIVVIRALLSDRLYRRDDVAIALNAPVRMSVLSAGNGRKRLPGGRGQAGRREADVARVADYLRGSVPANSRGPASLAVVAVDDPGFVAAAVEELVSSYARDGKRVAVADLTAGVLAKSLGVTEPGVRMVDAKGTRVIMVLPAPDEVAPIGPRAHGTRDDTPDNDVAAAYSGADVFITIAVLDPAVGADYLATWAGDAVAVVTAGQSSVTKVQAVGEMVRDAGTHLASGILLGADKDDESFGLVKA
jgi:capsular polysaccharide biosynthesis protein